MTTNKQSDVKAANIFLLGFIAAAIACGVQMYLGSLPANQGAYYVINAVAFIAGARFIYIIKRDAANGGADWFDFVLAFVLAIWLAIGKAIWLASMVR